MTIAEELNTLAGIASAYHARTGHLIAARRGRPGIQHRLQFAQLDGCELALVPPAPLDASAARPPAASARRLFPEYWRPARRSGSDIPEDE